MTNASPRPFFWSENISSQVFVVRHGQVANHQGDVSLVPAGKHFIVETANHLAHYVSAGTTVTILHAPTARTRETADELARCLESALRAQNKKARVMPPRVENEIRNFHFIVDGKLYPPTDRMHESLPASAEQNPFLNGFWQADQDPIAYWLTHPCESAELPAAVANRLGAFFATLLASPGPNFYIVVTHSGPMRAFLRDTFGNDPGEPEFCEAFQVDKDGVHYRGQHRAVL